MAAEAIGFACDIKDQLKNSIVVRLLGVLVWQNKLIDSLIAPFGLARLELELTSSRIVGSFG